MGKLVSAVAALAAVAAPLFGAAQAAYVDLTSKAVNSSGSTVVYEEITTAGVLKILVAPFLVDGWTTPTFTPTHGLTRYSSGLGINRSRDDSHQVDGKGPNEGILIQAQLNGEVQEVEFYGFRFGYYDYTDEVSIYGGDQGWGSMTGVDKDIDIGSGGWIWGDWDYASVMVAALEKNDDWKFKGFKFRFTPPDPDIDNPVPVPGAFPLMIAGLAAFAAARHRRT